jgi:calcium-independent phospholipase A2
MLLSMEKVMEVPTAHCYDWIAGTSTGGMLALALSSGRTVMDCQIMYMRLKDKVFVDSKPYSTKPMEDLLKKEFGDLKLFDIKSPK